MHYFVADIVPCVDRQLCHVLCIYTLHSLIIHGAMHHVSVKDNPQLRSQDAKLLKLYYRSVLGLTRHLFDYCVTVTDRTFPHNSALERGRHKLPRTLSGWQSRSQMRPRRMFASAWVLALNPVTSVGCTIFAVGSCRHDAFTGSMAQIAAAEV